MKKKILVTLASGVLASVFILSGCQTTDKPTSSSSSKIKIGYYGGTCESPIYVAYERGIFKKNGLDVELVKISGDTLKEGVASGKIDAIQVSPGLFKPIEQGLDIKLTNSVHTGCIQAVVSNHSSITSIKDLKGKTIGVDAIGGVPMTLLSVELSKAGIDPKKDVTWKAYPSPQLQQAMDKKEIDVFSTWDPFGELAIKDHKAHRIFSNTHSEHYDHIACCFIGINGKLLKEHPDVAKAITASFNEAGEWIEQNPKEAAAIAVEKKYTGGDVETAGKLLADYTFDSNVDRAKEGLRSHLHNMKQEHVLDPSTDPNQLLEYVFVDVDK